jgi:hypothetical protein
VKVPPRSIQKCHFSLARPIGESHAAVS